MAADLGRQRVEHELFVRAFLSAEPSNRVAAQLSQVIQDQRLKEGELLFRSGEPAERFHFVAEGGIELRAPGAQTWTLAPGSLVGMLDALIPRPRTRHAVAVEKTHLLTIEVVDYLDILEDNFGFAVATLRAHAERFRDVVAQMDPRRAFVEPAGMSNTARWSRAELETVERLLVLRHLAWFDTAPVQALVQLAHLSSVQRFRAGEQLFRPDDSVRTLHVVASGMVAARHGRTESQVSFGVHRVVTDLAVLGSDVHDWGAAAIEDTITLELRIDDLFDVAEDHFECCRSMLSYAARERARLSEAIGLEDLELGRMTL